jgi:hypothetical protein
MRAPPELSSNPDLGRPGGKAVSCKGDPGPSNLNGQEPGQEPGRQHPGGTAVPVRPWRYPPGHGLWLVRQVADDISVVTGPAGSTVTVVFAPVLSDAPGGFAGPEPAR